MIVLHKKEADESSAQLEERLERLVISFKTVVHAAGEERLPYIEEDGKNYHGDEEIKEWVEELEFEVHTQRSVTGDGCYINPDDGNIC